MPAEYNQSVFFSLVLLGARGGWLAGQVSLLHSTETVHKMYGTTRNIDHFRDIRYLE